MSVLLDIGSRLVSISKELLTTMEGASPATMMQLAVSSQGSDRVRVALDGERAVEQ